MTEPTTCDHKTDGSTSSFPNSTRASDICKNYKSKVIEHGQTIFPYVSIVFILLIVHIISVNLYKDYCVINYYNFYNVVFSVSPMCSYLLDIINICNGSLNKMGYIFGGFIIMKITNIFSKFNVFSSYSKKPDQTRTVMN